VQIRLLISPTGDTSVETVSIIEDLWHDYQFFKSQAADIEISPVTPDGEFVVKRYRRAALLMLVFYFEGVLNRWLRGILAEPDWLLMERKPIDKKVKCIEEKLAMLPAVGVDVSEAKGLRDAFAHLKPGGDLKLFEAVTKSLLEESEGAITRWLAEAEKVIGIERHPDTREVSRPLREALGFPSPGSEGYSGTE
jgi:hypothetical protein